MSDAKEVVDLRTERNQTSAARPPTPDEAPQIPTRLEWVPLPPEYPKFKVLLWRNYPQAVWKDVLTDPPAPPDLSEIEDEGERTALQEAWETERDAAIDRRITALGLIFREHNHWRDFNGEEYPPTNTRAFWDAVPQELALILVALADRAELPNSLRPTRRR